MSQHRRAGTHRVRPHRLRAAFTITWVALMGLLVAGLLIGWRAGWQLAVVQSASMDPAVPKGSLAVVAPVDVGQVAVGDVIAFRDPNARGRTVLHRVIEVGTTQGAVLLKTQGDANPDPDPGRVTPGAVQGRMVWQSSSLGTLALYLRPPAGLLLLVGIPLAYLVTSEMLLRRGSRDPAAQDGEATAAVTSD